MSTMDIIAWVVSTIVFGGTTIGGISWALSSYMGWKKVENAEPPKKSEPSENFKTESERIIDILFERNEFCSGDLFSKEDLSDLESLRTSSSFASLVRYAHFAGYHLTFEQNEQEWSSDPEYLDKNVFKTDLKEATALRGEQERNRYKRYFEPPRSSRDKVLSRNIS